MPESGCYSTWKKKFQRVLIKIPTTTDRYRHGIGDGILATKNLALFNTVVVIPIRRIERTYFESLFGSGAFAGLFSAFGLLSFVF